MKFKFLFIEALRTEPVDNWEQLINSDEYLRSAVELMGKIEDLEEGSQCLIVGGVVRDLLLKQPAHDIDLAANVDIKKIQNAFKTHEIGRSEEFGIVTVQYNGYSFEIAAFREEQGYSDNRRPDQVTKVKSFEKDTARRDISFNSLGLDRTGTIIDYQNGIEDLKNKVVKAVGKAQERFIEDSLRILRVARFAAKFGFQIEAETRQAMIELGHLIDSVSAERVHDELFKASATGSSLANFIEHLDDTGLLQRILPEIKDLQRFTHWEMHHPESALVKATSSNEWIPFDITNPAHQDPTKYKVQRGTIFGHVMAALRASQSVDPITNLSILFHDVQKAITATDKGEGKTAYPGHEDPNLGLFQKIADKLKFSNKEKEAILFAMEHHMKGHRIKELKQKNILVMRQNPNWPHLRDTMRADDASRGEPLFDPKEFEDRMEYIEDIFNKFGETVEFERRMAALVDGRLIMSLVPGIKGKEIGRVKSDTRDFIISRDFDVSKEEVVEYIKSIA